MENEAIFITKIKNIYIMLLDSISDENIDKVDHYLDDNLALEFRDIVNANIKNNVRQVFEYPNISNVKIVDESNKFITIEADTRFVEYKVNKNSGKITSGDGKTQTKKRIILVFRKNDIENKVVHKCPNCGANLNINSKSFCEYCSMPIDERYSQYVLCEIK